MEICKDLLNLENTVVGLGFFDGVHLGHQELIKQLVSTAKENNIKSVLITFQKSPAEKFIDNVEYLTLNEEKENLISNLGVDYLFELDFDDEMMNLSGLEYLEKIVFNCFKPMYIFTGFNHTFGKDKSGNPELLKINQEKFGYKYIEIPAVELAGEIVSSTRIRKSLKDGNVALANMLLGYNYVLSGKVIEGNKLGRTIGFPTANLIYPFSKVQIPYGVYSVSAEIEGQIYLGMLNYGTKPTVNKVDAEPILEVNIFNFDKNIYNKQIKINLIEWIREEQKFSSLTDLKSQIEKDLERCLK